MLRGFLFIISMKGVYFNMTDEQRQQIKQKIQLQIEELKAEIKSHEAASKPVEPDNAIGRLTRMEAISAKSISEASLNSARNRLTRLENSLGRIDSEDYGLCSECEEPIPFKRLLLLPEVTRCVQCSE